ncbi:MAG: polyprenol monophosphomannose synthase [Saprospiraceae bacterium]|nr:polyprenol monophosphomannose synthase [Saprospiraceae bacterium]
MQKLLVIIPTYNEAENIAEMLQRVMELPSHFHVLVVDDNSPDGTARIVGATEREFPGKIHLLEREGKLGLGTAYLAGFEWALHRNYDYVFEMDADFSHNPKHLERLYSKAKEGYDVVVGSRYIKKGRIVDWPLDRLILSYGASMYARLITGLPVKDPTAGFVVYNEGFLRQLDMNRIDSIGYAFQIEMKYAAYSHGFSLAEVPITFMDRQRGVSKMDSSIIKEAALGVIKMRLRKKGKYLKVPQSISV